MVSSMGVDSVTCGICGTTYRPKSLIENCPGCEGKNPKKWESAEKAAKEKKKLTPFETYHVLNTRDFGHIEHVLGVKVRDSRHMLRLIKECFEQLNAGEQNIVLCESMQEVTDALNGLTIDLQTDLNLGLKSPFEV
jgi:hypothetical protein